MSRAPKPTRPSPEVIPSPVYIDDRTSPGVHTMFPRTYTVFRRTWSGVRTPNFIKLSTSPGNSLPMNFSTADITWDENSDCLDSRVSVANPMSDFNIQRTKCLDVFGWIVGPLANHSASAQAKADTKLRSRVSEAAGFAIDLGEINQTVRMIATNVTRIAHAARSIRRGNIGGAFSALGIVSTRKFPGGPVGPIRMGDPLKLLANYWLEFVYGWKPLIQDVYASIGALEKFLEKNQWVMAARATGVDPISSSFKYPRTVGTFGPTHIGVEQHTGVSTCKYTLYYKRDDHVKIFLSQLGLTNPADLVWELLPFSFVVDWFLPIGPWLEALHAFDGLVFVKGTRVQHTVETSNLEIGTTYTGHEVGSPFYTITQFGSRVGTRIRFNRVPLSGFPTPNPPVPKSPVSVAHATNALALLVSMFK